MLNEVTSRAETHELSALRSDLRSTATGRFAIRISAASAKAWCESHPDCKVPSPECGLPRGLLLTSI